MKQKIYKVQDDKEKENVTTYKRSYYNLRKLRSKNIIKESNEIPNDIRRIVVLDKVKI